MKKILLRKFTPTLLLFVGLVFSIPTSVSAVESVTYELHPTYDAFMASSWTYAWDTTRAGVNVTFSDTLSSRPDTRVSDWYDGLTIHRYYVEFDTSDIAPTDKVISARLRLHFDLVREGNMTSNNGWVVVPANIEGSTSDQRWDSYSGTLDSTYSEQTRLNNTGYTDFVLNEAGLEALNKGGTTKLGFTSYWDAINQDPNQAYGPYISDWATLFLRNSVGTERDPLLIIETVPGDLPEENEYPLYTQIESMYPSIEETSDWEDDTFAHGSQEWCGDTIGGCGCAITSGVMAGRNADITTDVVGNDVNPKNINEYLRSVGGYTSDGSVYWLAMQAYLGEIADDGRLASRFQYVGKYEGSAAMSAADQYLENEGEYAVLAFKNSLGHFIWLPAKTDDSYVVRDPFWYLTQTADDTIGANIKDYNNSFDSVRVFKISEEPVVASGSGVEAYLKGTAELIYKDVTGSVVGYTGGGTVVNLPNSSYGNAEVIGLNGTPSPNTGGKHLLVSDASNEFTIEVIGTGTGGFEMEFFTISETGEVTTYSFSGQTIPGVTSTFTFNLETGEVKEKPLSYEQFLSILSLQLDGHTDQRKAFFMKWAEKMYSDMEEKTVSQALQTISVYGKLLVAKKIESPVLTSVPGLLTEGVKKR